MIDMVHSFDVPELLSLEADKKNDRELMAAHNRLIAHYAGNEPALASINAMFRNLIETRLVTLFLRTDELDLEKFRQIKVLAQFFSMTVLGNPKGVDYIQDLGESLADIDYWLRTQFIQLSSAEEQVIQLFVRINQAEILFKSQEQ